MKVNRKVSKTEKQCRKCGQRYPYNHMPFCQVPETKKKKVITAITSRIKDTRDCLLKPRANVDQALACLRDLEHYTTLLD